MTKAKTNSLDGMTFDCLTLVELCRFCGAEEAWVQELVTYGVVEPLAIKGSEFSFGRVSVIRAKMARRLERDLGVNMPGIALVLDLMEERNQLRRLLGHRRALPI